MSTTARPRHCLPLRIVHADVRALRAHHRDQFDRIRARASSSPGLFDEVLQENLERLVAQGYGIEDLALMYGVSGERVRQWLRRWHLTASRDLARVWDAGACQFRAVSHPGYWNAVREATVAVRAERAKASRRAMVEAVRAARARLGRAPTTREMLTAVGVRSEVTLARAWNPRVQRGGEHPYQRGLDRLRRLAGCGAG